MAAEITYDDELRKRLARHLSGHEVRTHPLEGRRRAAVAVIVIDSDAVAHGEDNQLHERDSDARRDIVAGIPGIDEDSDLTFTIEGTAGGAAFLLTRRGSHLNRNAGQWALPGGRVDQGETPIEAALREIEEEIGLVLGEDSLLGRLDDYPTRSGFVMTPFVFWAGFGAEPVANPEEVDSVHRIGIRELTKHEAPRFIEIPESDRPVIQVPIGGDLIHAPTGAVLHQFRRVAYEGTLERVDEYEQPVFAWR